jgi:hypothetical protein
MTIRKPFIFLFFSIVFVQNLAAQRGWEVGGWAGVSHYFGDLNTDWRVNHPNLSGGAFGRFNFNDRLCVKLGANYAKIGADDANSKNAFEQRRNLSFQTNIFDASANFEFNFLTYIHGHRDYFYTPYMTAGFTGFRFNPKTKYDGKWTELRPQGTEGQFRGDEYGTFLGALNYGIGLKMDITYRLSFNLEFSVRDVWTDYLDDVSGNYPDLEDLRATRGNLGVALSDRSENPKIGLSGRQRGNGKKNDMYTLLGGGIVYYFGDIRCPTVGKF